MFRIEPGSTAGTIEVRQISGITWDMGEGELFDLYRALNDFISTNLAVQNRYMERLLEEFKAKQLPIKPTQHCTSEECFYTFSHTASWCYYEQPRRCGCKWCYEDER